MPELPKISGNEASKVFTKLGFYQARQKGSHLVMRRNGKGYVIPRHKELPIALSEAPSNRPESRLTNLLPPTKKSKDQKPLPVVIPALCLVSA